MSLLDRKDRKLRRAARKADREERREIRRTDRLSGTRLGQFLRNPSPYKHPKQGPYKENKNK